MSFISVAIYASDFSTGGLHYEINSPDQKFLTVVSPPDSPYSLKEVEIPAIVNFNQQEYFVTQIGPEAFSSASSLQKIIIPGSVISIAEDAFRGCSSLSDISFMTGNYVEDSYVSLDFPAWTSTNHSDSTESSKEYEFSAIPGAVLSLDYIVSSEKNYDIFSIYINNVVIFQESGTDKTGHFTYTFESNGQYTLKLSYKKDGSQSSGTDNVIVSNINVSQGYNDRLWLSSDILRESPIKKLYLSRNINYSSTSYSPFSSMQSLEDLVFGEGLTSIPSNCFYGCSSLEEISIPGTIQSINSHVFSDCTNLKAVNILEGEVPLSVSTESFGTVVEKLQIARNLQNISNASIFNNKLLDVTFGEEVTEIPQRLFQGCSNLSAVIFPTGLTTIGTYAFYGCSALETVIIPPALNYIGTNAFSSCSGLKKSVYPNTISNPFSNGVAISYSAEALTDEEGVIFNEDKTTLIFAPLGLAGEYDIPETVSSLGNSAFYACQYLTGITIPKTINQIGSDCFRSCESLVNLNYNAIDCNAYSSTSNSPSMFPSTIKNINFGTEVTSIPARFLYNGCVVERIELPNSCTKIGDYSFRNCSNLKSITFGSKLQTISSGAFSGTSPKKAVWLGNTPPSGVNNISANVNFVSNNQYPFSESNTKRYPFLSSKFEIEGAIYVPVSASERTCDVIDCTYNPENNSLIIPQIIENRGVNLSVLEVNSYALYGNSYLTAAQILCNGKLGSYAFNNCNNLQSIVLKNKGDIEASVFAGCNSLQSAEIDIEGSIGNNSFDNLQNLATVTLGEGIDAIGDYAFRGCKELTSLNIPNSVVSLGTGALQNCSSLSELNMGSGIKTLLGYVLDGCSSLAELFIPATMKSIGSYTFNGCTALSRVTFQDCQEDDAEDIDHSYIGENWVSTNTKDSSYSDHLWTFNVWSGDVLTFEWSVDSESGYDYLDVTVNGVNVIHKSGSNQSGTYRQTFNYTGPVIIEAKYSKDGSVSNGKDQASISNMMLNGMGYVYEGLYLGSNGASALFSDCPLNEVYIGRRLLYSSSSSAGYSPFYRNTSIRTVEISDVEKQIYDNEFYGCTNLHTLTIGNGVESIGNWAFSGCASLDYFSAGFNVKKIGEEAFSDCIGLKNYYSFSIIPPVCGNQALDDINKWECTLHVPAESGDEYRSAEQWKEFFFLDEMDAIPMTEIRLNETELSLVVDDTFQFTVQIIPSNATNQKLIWASSDSSVATVSDSGYLTAVGAGDTTITVTSYDGSVFTQCYVIVSALSDINTVGEDIADREEIYTLSGIRLDIPKKELTSGMYIIRQPGKKSRKIMVQ